MVGVKGFDGEKVRSLRARRGMTQVELAQMTGLTETSVNRIEQGIHSPRISSVRRIAEALRVQEWELYDGLSREDRIKKVVDRVTHDPNVFEIWKNEGDHREAFREALRPLLDSDDFEYAVKRLQVEDFLEVLGVRKTVTLTVREWRVLNWWYQDRRNFRMSDIVQHGVLMPQTEHLDVEMDEIGPRVSLTVDLVTGNQLAEDAPAAMAWMKQRIEEERAAGYEVEEE